jgi:hypothetical protein
MPHTSSKNNVFRQFKKLEINDNTVENNGKEDWGKADSTSSCTFPLTFQVDDINKDQSDCGDRSIMGRKRGSYECRQVSTIDIPLFIYNCSVLTLCSLVFRIRMHHCDGIENEI